MKNKLSPEVEKAVAEAVKSYPAKWTGGVCGFTVIDKKNGSINRNSSRSNGACHAGITYLNDKDGYIVVNSHKAAWQKKNKDFLLWCAQGTPFAEGVLNRDDEKELLNHAMVLDTSIIGKGGVLWVCKAVRHFVEDIHKLDTWTKLRENGLDELQAFIGADILTSTGDPNYANTHVSLFRYTSPTNLRKDYDEVRNLKRIDSAQANRGGYTGGERVNWGTMSFMTLKKKDGWGGFTEIRKPADPKDYVAKLKEIFEGDPKNVG
jgi:hypothetical protein